MDWSNELLASAIWLGKAFSISVLGLIVTAWALCRFTGWGRQFRRLAWPYFTPSRSWKPLGALALIVFMTLFEVRLNVLHSYWYKDFYNAMQELNAPAFWFMSGIFCLIAGTGLISALLAFYVRQALLIEWRQDLTEGLLKRWFERQGYYRTRYIEDGVDNPDQRIQQDIERFASSSLSLSMGLLDAVVSLFTFTIILWSLSGALQISRIEVPRAMVFLVYIYVILATVVAVWLGRPLIRLNFLSEKLNADFRYALIRVREYGESIAFFRGERIEGGTLNTRFAAVIGNMWAIVFRSLKFQGFNITISQAAVLFPMVVQAPRLFSKQISLGDVLQTAQAFGQVQGALSFFRSSYDEFASYRAVLTRLNGFLDAMAAAENLPAVATEQRAGKLVFDGLTVRTPANAVLLSGLNLSMEPGSALLIRGPSGAGKTTLLRAVAGLWPFVDGKVVRPPSESSLFLPQKPYLPLGSLRGALYYPAAPADDINAAAEVLRQCQLGHLVSRLDEEADWTGILSLGEQQRLAIGRALIAKPEVLFLDEASSAMDEGLEYAMYRLIREALPQAILVSVGHRSSLLEFHTDELELLAEGRWALRKLS